VAVGRWKDQDYLLDRMDVAALNRAYLSYPGVWSYALLTAVAVAGAIRLGGPSLLGVAATIAAVVLLYPVFWYTLHRFVLHSRYLWKARFTARVWKRIHYDHHRQPNNLSVLFGSLEHTVPTVVILCGPVGYLLAGPAGVLWACAAGFAMTMVYEYVHCIQHLGIMPKSRTLQQLKRRHLLHHFHNEKGNYGIIEFWPDRLFGTFYREVGSAWPKSPDTRDLGYHGQTARDYPYVEDLSRETRTVPAGRGSGQPAGGQV
jgi:sterol desaturase/sphingolipid hydroxylase (fatty acid hydroxylase superfamily)